MLRAAADAAYLGRADRPAHAAALRRRSGDPEPTRGAAETRDAFVALLGGGDAMVPLVELLDEHGLLVRYLPEWDSGPLPAAAQRVPPLHRRPPPPRGGGAAPTTLVRSVRRPDLLLVGALLHDLGKGGRATTPTTASCWPRRSPTRMGFAPADVAVLVDLVRHHLLLPSFATGRDLDDPATIAAVADAVGTEDTLDLLAALTVADSIATGPTAWGRVEGRPGRPSGRASARRAAPTRR